MVIDVLVEVGGVEGIEAVDQTRHHDFFVGVDLDLILEVLLLEAVGTKDSPLEKVQVVLLFEEFSLFALGLELVFEVTGFFHDHLDFLSVL